MLRSRRAMSIAAAVTVLASPLASQEAVDTTRLPTVVTTATRSPLSQLSAPVAVTVITGAELRARGVTHVADALRDVPGVALAQAGSAGSPTALFLRGGESKYVKVLVDGVPVNEAGGAFDFGTLTTYNVDRIEIVRGPASVLYGSDAVTGVVQIFTRRGRGQPQVTATSRAGSYGTFDSEITFGGAAGPAAFSFGLSTFQTEGSFPFNSAYRNNGVSALVELASSERTDARLSARYSDNRVHFPTTGSGVVADSNQFRAGDRLSLGLDLGHSFTPRLRGRLLLASSRTDVGGANDPDSPGDSLDFYYTSAGDTRRRSADASVTALLAPIASLTVGAALEDQRETSFSDGRSRFGPSTSSFSATRRSTAAYTQLLLTSGDAFSATIGGRYDESETFGGFATYRVAANARIAPGSRLRAAVGTAFREPQFYENFSTAFSVGNPSLQPERTASWEIGASQELGARALIAASYFAQRFSNMIDYTFAPPSEGGPNYYNIARARANGVEIEARTTVVRGFALDASYTRLWTRVLDPGFDASAGALLVRDARLLRRPTHSASLGATYRGERARFNLTAHRIGDRDDRDYSGWPPAPVTHPWYTRVDAGGELRIVEPRGGYPGASLTFRVDNVENRAYQTVYGFAAPGRSVLAGVRVEF